MTNNRRRFLNQRDKTPASDKTQQLSCVCWPAVHVISGQINGEFWWLNSKLAAIRNFEPPPPKIDDTNENETDESVKIVFKDEDGQGKIRDDKVGENNWQASFVFREDGVKSVDVKSDIKVNNKILFELNTNEYIPVNNTIASNSEKESEEKLEDVFEFVFPESVEEDNKITTASAVNKSKVFRSTPKDERTPNKIAINDKIWFEDDDDAREDKNNFEETESICTFLKKQECLRNKGVVHKSNEHLRNCPKHRSVDDQKVCCILPHRSEVSAAIRYPEESSDRFKRSAAAETNAALKQRNALLQRKFVTVPVAKPTAATQAKITQKIVTPDDYADPYWNVKNPSQTNTKYDYVSQEYGDYTVELPKPGLIGLYSDLGSSQTTWQLSNKKGFNYGGGDDVSDEDSEEIPFGYSTFDPRKNRKRGSTVAPNSRRPMKIKIPDEITEPSRPITFKSNPDFHVLEGFKLLNLAKKKNRFVRTTLPFTITESHAESNIQPCQMDADYEDSSEQQQVYRKCGKSVMQYTGSNEDIAEEGFDPWLALVIRTKSRQKILCYATIVHPRAAVTAADCVVGSKPGELSVLSGVWELRSQSSSQQRLCTVHAHSQYNGELDNNIALLSWKRPLKLEAGVQPACVADPHVGDHCYFVGWAGYDQAMESTARRQKATILTPRQCAERISKPDVTLPRDAFCAAVKSRGTVTGVGGPLLCRNGDRTSLVGLAVWREDVVVLLPVTQFVAATIPDVAHD
ncbi:uncharacterized protein LOC121735040 [Aricia agestis]|uniref:uncharacterized protein LOC121735040 n=1 Tax=Aricia agestis TaxID=91739 RepID=UPI001C20740F|nr:uncharacterized protein LOC121735040 [Aricia agestis]